MSKSALYYLHDASIVHRNPNYVPPRFIIHLLIFSEVTGSDTWLVNRPDVTLSHSKDLSSDILITDFIVSVYWIFSPETCLVCVSFDPAVPGTSIDLGHCFLPSQKGWVMSLPDILSQEGTATSSLCQSFMRRPNADYLLLDRRLCPPWVCLYDFCTLHHSQELHAYRFLSRPATSPDHRASTVTCMAHGSCNSNQNTTSVARARTSFPRPVGVTRSAWYEPVLVRKE